ncbi:Nicotinate-nucleotide adenylyltransferase [Porphyromonas macacae]|uniref:Probable nicotinate-nucleotide adenylyltransferase n=1 Tax=Porphyromonas macacae TaxID=28115 RepID=A0A379E968_9PORP|nr:nicotinate (nicotinamide) nucleotide adenylyltransferase [Porphyromonas macacae]SUB89216.1 Nicotinate-nucleotide adenylyltransferase [Porphyromonas macacae]
MTSSSFPCCEEKKRNVCLYFGSFNPLHIGHLAIANYLAVQNGIDEVWFVLSPVNPWKDLKEQLPFEFRASIINDAIKKDTRFRLCTIEAILPRPHYTVSSLRAISLMHPDTHFQLLIGGDNWAKIHKWHQYGRLLAGFTVYIYPRRGYPVDITLYGTRPVYLENAPIMEISSTAIRNAVKNNIDLRHWIAGDYWEQLVTKLNQL